MGSFIVSVLQYFGAIIGLGLAAVVLNILSQLLLPRDPTKPPVVFHYVPIIGCAVSYGMDPYKFLDECRKKYGNVFTYPMLGRKITVSLGPLGADYVLNGRLAYVNAEQAYTHLTTPVFGTEVVYDCPNSKLMEQKKFVKYGLTTENFRKYVGLIEGEVLDYFTANVFGGGDAKSDKTDGNDVKTSTNTAKTATVDALDMTSEITICTATATLQGAEIRRAMDKTFAQLYHDLDGGFTPLNFVFPQLPLPSYRKRDNANARMTEFYINIMNERRKRPETDYGDMLAALQNQTYKTGEPLTDKQIAHIMIALLMAGQHTSASTSSWILLHLGEKPELQEALYAEQVQHYGEPDGSLRKLDYETLLTPLVVGTIKEALRMHPPIHSIMRKVIQDYPVPATLAAPSKEPEASDDFKRRNENLTYTVPKGHFVLTCPGLSQVDTRIWGTDAKEFNPHRWIDGSLQKSVAGEETEADFGWGKVSTGGKSAFLPFGAGRHRCIGEQFANVQLGTLISTLVRNYTWTLEAGHVPGNDYTAMMVVPLEPRKIVFTRRE